jgi:hypothetical protein
MVDSRPIGKQKAKKVVVAREYKLGKIAGLDLSVEPWFFVGTIALWLVLSGVGVWVLELPLSQAVLGGVVTTVLYWVSDIVHQLGHAYAAQRTGYPMTGIRLGTYLIFGTALYPDDEGELPAAVHIRRALGGPIGSLTFSIITGVIAMILYPA